MGFAKGLGVGCERIKKDGFENFLMGNYMNGVSLTKRKNSRGGCLRASVEINRTS